MQCCELSAVNTQPARIPKTIFKDLTVEARPSFQAHKPFIGHLDSFDTSGFLFLIPKLRGLQFSSTALCALTGCWLIFTNHSAVGKEKMGTDCRVPFGSLFACKCGKKNESSTLTLLSWRGRKTNRASEHAVTQ